MQFGKFAHRRGYVRFLEGEQRLSKDQVFNALHEWLTAKVIDQTDPFGWRGYSLTPVQIQIVSDQASKDWQHGWLS